MATIKDIAREAQVAPMTVSRAVNAPDRVKPETLEKIKEAMQRLHYVPNRAAISLVSKRTGVIDVFIPRSIDLSNPFVMHFIAGISQTLAEKRYSFLLIRDLCEDNPCDGYIVTGLLRDEIRSFHDYARRYERPLVLFGHTDIADVDTIDVDNIKGAYLATRRLLDAGHRSLAMINVNEDKDYRIDRQEGFRKALAEDGIALTDSMVSYADNNVSGGALCAESMTAGALPTAIFCATDTIAIGVAKALGQRGIRVPEDISLVGFDGLGHHLLSMPRLTTIQQPIYQIGVEIARMLVTRIEGRTQRQSRLLDPVLIEEQSVMDFTEK
jgi:DNA-binding LacI/PurR family transcriptional regulator